jgi:(p)ppGpp synthase/HD superfamily hydrolase
MDTQIALFQSLIGCTIDEIGTDILSVVRKVVPKADILSRIKDPITLKKKMLLKKTETVTDIRDVYAYRILVRTDAEAYRILEIIGATFDGYLKNDFIKKPKQLFDGDPIMMRMLQYVAKKNSVYFEIQITTREYHEMNESCHDNYHRRKYGPQL